MLTIDAMRLEFFARRKIDVPLKAANYALMTRCETSTTALPKLRS